MSELITLLFFAPVLIWSVGLLIAASDMPGERRTHYLLTIITLGLTLGSSLV